MKSLLIRPHKNAPLFDSGTDLQQVLGQLLRELGSKSFKLNEEVAQYMRQASLVNLWFWLKIVCAVDLPFNLVNDDLHIDMANFRQSDDCMNDGSRGAVIVPRGFLKTAVASIGGDSWEIIRNRDIRIGLVNAVAEHANNYVAQIKDIFVSGSLVKALFPDYAMTGREPGCGEGRFTIRDRSRNYKEPTVLAMSVTSSGEGFHGDLLNPDDLIGMEMLDSNHNASAQMDQANKWWDTNSSTLLLSAKRSRIVGAATRFSPADTYEKWFKDCRKLVGFQHPKFVPVPNGRWVIYYRKAKENGVFINPEVMDEQSYNALDTWTRLTQEDNDPYETDLIEFHGMKLKPCEVRYDSESDRFFIRRKAEEKYGETDTPFVEIPLDQCDVVGGLDPASTDSGVTARTSRTASEVWVRDWNECSYLIWSMVDYVDEMQMIDSVLQPHRDYSGYIREYVIESNAMQKIIAPIIEREALRENLNVNTNPVPVSMNKVSRIRNVVGTRLKQGTLYGVPYYSVEVNEELDIFPADVYKMDALDAAEKALRSLETPESPVMEATRSVKQQALAYSTSSEVSAFEY